jgi:hypothetical protein
LAPLYAVTCPLRGRPRQSNLSAITPKRIVRTTLPPECLTTRLGRVANDHGHESRATRLSAAPYRHLAISRADVVRIQLIPLSVG